jgi:hypothetical protein
LIAETAADEALIQKVAAAMRANNIEVHVVDTGEEAREAILAMIPPAAEVHSGKSKTLMDVGLWSELFESGKYDALRPKYTKMDRATQEREIRKMVSGPDWMLGSVNAVTESGDLVTASATGGQLGPYAMGAGKLILVIGSQKIVPDLDAALKRIDEVVFPYEDASVLERLKVHTSLNKILVLRGEWTAGRTTVYLVRESVGV